MFSDLSEVSPQELLKRYSYEALGLLLAVFFVVSYFAGGKRNQNLINTYYRKCQDFYENNFAHVGVTKEPNGPLFHSESAHQFKFFASGRINCVFAQLNFELCKRQDIISEFLFSFIWPEKDQIKFDIPLSVAPQPICFAILKKKDAATYKENNSDIKYLTQKVMLDNLEKNYIVLGEDSDTMSAVLDSKILSYLNKYDKYISQIHLTDQKSLSQYPYHLRVVINQSSKQEEVLDLTQMVFYIVDKVASVKLPPQIRQKNEKERQKYEELKLKDEKLKRMEELQKKKQEAKQKEQQKLLSLPREKQLQIQEKEKKDEIRKRLSKRIQRV